MMKYSFSLLWDRFQRQFKKPGKHSAVSVPLFTASNPAYAKHQIGIGTYGNPIILDWGSKLTIGKYCSLADGVIFILGGNHRPDWISTYPFNVLWPGFSGIQGHPATKGDTIVGNDVWIGTKSLILSGVRIGSGAVIGAGSVVTKDVPDYAVVAGNPAKFIRFRFGEEIIKLLVASAWWDLSEDKIRAIVPLIMNANIDLFLEKLKELKSNDTRL